MTDTPVRLEAAARLDAEGLASLRARAMQASLDQMGRFDHRRAREKFLAAFSTEHTRHVLVGGDRVGFVVVRLYHGELQLDHLCIQPEHQGRGVGSFVLAQVFGEADSLGKSIRVGALRDSASNLFYARHGFDLVEQAQWGNYYVRQALGRTGGR
jgi:ribosomal protein S18 acetylase RimI-like enzyme